MLIKQLKFGWKNNTVNMETSSGYKPEYLLLGVSGAHPTSRVVRELRRQSDSLRAQHLWDAIKAVRCQKQIPAIPRMARYTEQFIYVVFTKRIRREPFFYICGRCESPLVGPGPSKEPLY